MQKLTSPFELIKKSFAIFSNKDNFLFFVKIYALLLPFALLSLAQDYFLSSQSKNLNLSDPGVIFSHYPWFMWTYLTIGIVYLVVMFWVSVSGILAVSGVVDNKKTTVKEVFSNSWKKLWPFSLLSIVLGILTVLGLVLLIIPGILVLVWFNFAGFEMILKGSGIKESMLNSKKLVNGRFWKVFGRMVVFGIFMLLIQLMFSLAPYNIGSLVTPILGALTLLPYFLLYKELSVSNS